MDDKRAKLGGGRGAALLKLFATATASSSSSVPSIASDDQKSSSTDPSEFEKPTGVGRGHSLTRLLPISGRGFTMGRGSALSTLLGTAQVGRGLSPISKLAPKDSPEHLSPPRDVNQNVATRSGRQSPKSPPFKVDKLSMGEKCQQVLKSEGDLPAKLGALEIADDQVVEYHGTSGSQVPLFVNCVKVKCRNDAVFQYHVTFSPVVDSRRLRFSLLNQHREEIGKTKAFDGIILYLPKQLGQETIFKSERPTDQTVITIKISLTQKLDPASYKLIPFYNTVLRRSMDLLKMCPVGRNYYDPNNPKNVERYKLTLWPGYVTAIKSFEGGLLLNIDVSHKVLRNETARHIMESIYKQGSGMFKENCVKELVGSVVLTRYNNKNYRVDDIAWDITPTSTFTNSKGETLSYQEYYKCQYRIDIKDLLQPMLIHRPKKITQREQREKEGEDRIICLVPELCHLTGLSDKLRTDFRAMKEIKEHTCLAPMERINCIKDFLNRVNNNEEARNELLRWGLEMEVHPSKTLARQFPSENILVGNQQVFRCQANADFTRDVTRSKVIAPVSINNWLLLFTRRDANKAEQFFRKMTEVCRPLGMDIGQPNFIELRNDSSSAYKDAISSAMNPGVQLVVCIFPTSRDDRYSAVKKLCCVYMPVPSQVIISRTLPDDPKAGKFRSVTMKIALQINCKMGGELWAVDIPLKDLMICGVDVYHEPGGRGNSVAAFVASTNRLLTRWYSRAVIQQPHQELMGSLKICLTEAIKKYYEVNHALPGRIVLFRDGVGDGQLSTVADHEVVQLRSCFAMFDKMRGGEPYAPKLSVVIVSKRINVKLFSQQQQGLGNPPPGTVLDHLATRRNWPDFFLVSQHVRHGTVSPTHYVVVSGHSHLKADHMQRLAYKLTHMYYNWPGTVRVPAPCQYAHKLAYLVGQNIRQEPSAQLSDRLFYL